MLEEAAGISGLHTLLAMLLSGPMLELNPAEAEEYGAAAHQAARHYKFPIKEKHMDLMLLLTVAWKIDKPKFEAYAVAQAEKRKKPRPPAPPAQPEASPGRPADDPFAPFRDLLTSAPAEPSGGN